VYNPKQKEKEKKMKKLTLFAVLASLLMTAAPAYAGWYRAANTWTQKNAPLDKNLHVGIGLGISHMLKTNGASPLVSVAVPATIGLVKESTDKNFSASDLLSWIAGGIVGAILDDTGVKVEPNQENGGINLLVYID
jgi:hypothetical protein